MARDRSKPPQPGHTSRAVLIRRALLQLAAAAAAGASGWAQPAAAAEPACQLQASATGLQWCDLSLGTGAPPIPGAFTKAHYTARIGSSSGFQFASTYARNEPLIFKVGQREVIEAFDVAMLGAPDIPPMREGGRRLVLAPPGPMQRQGVKSLTWMTGMLDALEESGELAADGSPTAPLLFELELLPKRQRR